MRGASKIWFKRSSYSGAHTTLTWQKKKERRDSWTGWYANSEVNLLDTLLGSRVRQMGDTRPLALTARLQIVEEQWDKTFLVVVGRC